MVGADDWSTPLHPGWAEFWEMWDYANDGSMHDRYGPRKPFVPAETGTVYDPNASSTKKGNWFRAIPAAAKKMEYLRGISFFDSDVSAIQGPNSNFKVDYPTTNSDVYAGFKRMAMDPWFNTR